MKTRRIYNFIPGLKGLKYSDLNTIWSRNDVQLLETNSVEQCRTLATIYCPGRLYIVKHWIEHLRRDPCPTSTQ